MQLQRRLCWAIQRLVFQLRYALLFSLMAVIRITKCVGCAGVGCQLSRRNANLKAFARTLRALSTPVDGETTALPLSASSRWSNVKVTLSSLLKDDQVCCVSRPSLRWGGHSIGV